MSDKIGRYNIFIVGAICLELYSGPLPAGLQQHGPDCLCSLFSASLPDLMYP